MQAYPTPEQDKVLRGVEQSVFNFLDMSKNAIQKLLYQKAKDNIPSRMLALLAKRFTGSMGNKAILCFDKDNSRFIQNNGAWFVEIALKKGKNPRERILISRTDNSYYEDIEHLSQFPFTLVRENDKYFVYVSIPVQKSVVDCKVIGVDFNFRNWVASEPYGKPFFFNVKEYEKQIDDISKKIAKAKRLGDNVDTLYHKRSSIVKLAHGNFISKLIERFGICTLAIESISTMYKLTKKGSKMVNNWLYSKTALRKFAIMAMVKGFNLVEVDPKETSQLCYRCGSKGVVYGKHQRLFQCFACGLKDYNRDVNAARNIALRVIRVNRTSYLDINDILPYTT
jgi:transposase